MPGGEYIPWVPRLNDIASFNPSAQSIATNYDPKQFEEYNKYIPGGVTAYTMQDPNVLLGHYQSAAEKWGKFAFNIPGNMVDMFAESILNPIAAMTGNTTGVDLPLNNIFGEIYSKYNDSSPFHKDDLASYLKSADSLISSSVPFLVMGAGIAKGLSTAAGLLVGTRAARAAQLAAQGATATIMAATEGVQVGNQMVREMYPKLVEKYSNMGYDHVTATAMAQKESDEAFRRALGLNTIMNAGLNLTMFTPFFRAASKLGNAALIDDVAELAAKSTGIDDISKGMRDLVANKLPQRVNQYNRAAKLGILGEAGQESIEELNNQYAQEAGERLAERKTTLWEDLTDIGSWLDTAGSEEGIYSAVLGALGGGGQKMLMSNTPMPWKSQVANVTDDSVQLNKDGSIATTGMRISNHAREVLGLKAEYIRGADMVRTEIERQEKAIKDLSKLEDPVARSAKIKEIFSVDALRSVQMGYADLWINQFKHIAGLDNTKPYAEKLQGMIGQIDQELSTTTNEARRQELEAEKAQLATTLNSVGDMTEAQRFGVTRDAKDNSYVEKAEWAIDDIKEVKSVYEKYKNKYGTVDDYFGTDYAGKLAYHDISHRAALHKLDMMETRFKDSMKEFNRRSKDKSQVTDWTAKVNSEYKVLNELKRQMDVLKADIDAGILSEDSMSLLKSYNQGIKLDGPEAVVDLIGKLSKAYNSRVTRLNNAMSAMDEMSAEDWADETKANEGFRKLNDFTDKMGNMAFDPDATTEEEEAELQPLPMPDTSIVKRYKAAKKKDPNLSFREYIDQVRGSDQMLEKLTDLSAEIEVEREKVKQSYNELKELDTPSSFYTFMNKYREYEQRLAKEYEQANLDEASKAKLNEKPETPKGQTTTEEATDDISKEIAALNKQIELLSIGMGSVTNFRKLIKLRRQREELFKRKIRERNEAQQRNNTKETPAQSSENPETNLDETTDPLDINAQIEKVAKKRLADIATAWTTSKNSGEALRVDSEEFVKLYGEVASRIMLDSIPIARLVNSRGLSADSIFSEAIAEAVPTALPGEVAILKQIWENSRVNWANMGPEIKYKSLLQAVDTDLAVVINDQVNLAIAEKSAAFSHAGMVPFVANGTITQQEAAFLGSVAIDYINSEIARIKAEAEKAESDAANAKVDTQTNPSEAVEVTNNNPEIKLDDQSSYTTVFENGRNISNARVLNDPNAYIGHYRGKKTLTLNKINRPTIGYYSLITGANQSGNGNMEHRFINIRDLIIRKNLEAMSRLTPGTSLALELDKEWDGTILVDNDNTVKDKLDFQPTTKPDKWKDYVDASEKVPMDSNEAVKLVANIPIKVVNLDYIDPETGKPEVVGYYPRTDWGTSGAPLSLNLRNMGYEVGDGGLTAEVQANFNVRLSLVKAHNSNPSVQWRSKVGIVTNKGSVFTSVNPILNYVFSPAKRVFKLAGDKASVLLPDKSINIGIATNEHEVSLGNQQVIGGQSELIPGAPYAIAKDYDGSMIVIPLSTEKLSNNDLTAVRVLINAYISGNTKHQNTVKAGTGNDILTAPGLRKTIQQYFTWVSSGDITSILTSPVATKGTGYLSILDNGTIQMGIVGEQQSPITFDPKAGKPMPDSAIQILDRILANRNKTINFNEKGIQGVNNTNVYQHMEWLPNKKTGGSFTFPANKRFDSYNDYVKSVTLTAHYGRNTMADGRYVYSSNPQVHLTTPVEPVPETGGLLIGLKPETGDAPATEMTSDEMDLLGDLVGGDITEFSSTGVKPVQPIADNAIPATIENLELLSNLAGNNHNGRSVAEVKQELDQKGELAIAKGKNPFRKCP